MADLAVYSDTFLAAEAALSDMCPNIGMETPSDPDDTLSWLPFLRVQRIGGSSDLVTDSPRLVIDALAASKGAASLLARRVQQRLISGPINTTGGNVDVGATTSGPQYVPWSAVKPGQPGYVARYTATYSIELRRP